jgi:uncharacterized protein YcbX
MAAQPSAVLLGLSTAAIAVLVAVLLRQRSLRRSSLARQEGQLDEHNRIAALYIHPIKGMRRQAVDAVELDAHGAALDRRFLVVDSDGRFLTQRQLPLMATLTPSLTTRRAYGPDDTAAAVPSTVTITSATGDSVTAVVVDSTAPGAELRRVVIWGQAVEGAVDQGPAIAKWLSAALGKEGLALVYMDAHCIRPITDK